MKNKFKTLIRRFDHWLHRPKFRELDGLGQPVCWNCRVATNRHYALHDQLPCWNCGAVFPPLPPEKKAILTAEQLFIETVAKKYGAKAAARKKDYDLHGYHPNDRRRTVKFSTEDFAEAQKHGLLHLLGCRIIPEGQPQTTQ